MAGTKSLVVGFDGFIDTITRPLLRAAGPGHAAEYYPDIPSLGLALQHQGGKSCSIQLEPVQKRPGGNAPLLAAGAVGLGMEVSCIGLLGRGTPHPLFAERLAATLYPYAEPGESTAMEFSDGKVFFAADVTLERPAWELIVQATGGRAAEIIAGADGLAIVNWSELGFAPRLWQDVLEQALLPAPANRGRTVLFDLSDCTRKRPGEIEQVLELMGRYSARRRTLLSLNANEAGVVARRVLKTDIEDHTGIAHRLRQRYGIDAVLVHSREQNTYVTPAGEQRHKNQVIAEPCISTGAGDHYNAAVCYACANGYTDADTLAFAAKFVGRYLQTGATPKLAELA